MKKDKNGWISVKDTMPQENETVDVFMERGDRMANSYYKIKETAHGNFPMWYFRNGFSVWKPLHNQDVLWWRPLPEPPVEF